MIIRLWPEWCLALLRRPDRWSKNDPPGGSGNPAREGASRAPHLRPCVPQISLVPYLPLITRFLAVTPSQPHGEWSERRDGWFFCDGSQSGTFSYIENECDVVTSKIRRYGVVRAMHTVDQRRAGAAEPIVATAGKPPRKAPDRSPIPAFKRCCAPEKSGVFNDTGTVTLICPQAAAQPASARCCVASAQESPPPKNYR